LDFEFSRRASIAYLSKELLSSCQVLVDLKTNLNVIKTV